MLAHVEITEESEEFQNAITLYTESFLPIERIPVESIVSMLKEDKNYHMYVTKIKDVTVGFSLLYVFGDLKIGFLAYMAVDQKYRGKNIGSQIFYHVFEECKKLIDTPIGLLMEIQRSDVGNVEEATKRKKRISFYSRLGANLLKDVNHFLIPQQGYDNLELVHLMIKPYGEMHSLTKKQVLEYINSIYKKIYRYDKEDVIKKIEKNMPLKIDLVSIEQ